GAVLLGGEGVVGRVVAHGIVDRLDEAVRDGDAGQRREVALGDAEGHLHALGVAPVGHHAAAAHDEAARPATRPHRTEHAAGALGLVGDTDAAAVVQEEIAPHPRIVGAVIRDRVVEPTWIQPRIFGLGRRPVARRRGYQGGVAPLVRRGYQGGVAPLVRQTAFHARAVAATPVGHATPVPPWPQ